MVIGREQFFQIVILLILKIISNQTSKQTLRARSILISIYIFLDATTRNIPNILQKKIFKFFLTNSGYEVYTRANVAK